VFFSHGGHYEDDSGAGTGNQAAWQRASVNRSTELFLLDHMEGTTSHDQANVTVADKDTNVLYRHSVAVDSLDVDGYDFAADESLSLTGAQFSSGYSGIGGNDIDELLCYEFFDCTGPLLIATGLATGDKLQLRNVLGVVVAEATESSGTATIDMTQVTIPEVNDVVVVDSGGDLLGGLTLAGSGGPMEYARGGDEYSFTAGAPDPQPGKPAVTITGLNTTGVTAETSVFQPSTAGGSHVQTDWRITRLSDAVAVTISSTSNLTSITNAGSTIPLDTDANRYSLEVRHGEST
jgi:hypothetical protein